MDDKIMNQLLKFADDTKIFSRIRTDEEADNLRNDLDTLLNWTNDWQMQFNVKNAKSCTLENRNKTISTILMETS